MIALDAAHEHWLLAQNPVLDSIQHTFTTGPSAVGVVVFISGAVFVLAMILIAARLFVGRGERDDEPAVDYLTTAVDLLGLSESDRRLLQKVAASANLRQPAAMLLSPENLAAAAGPLLKSRRDDAVRRRIENLCRQLFEVPLPPPKPREQKHPSV